MPYEWFKRQCAFLHEHHVTDRWDLKDREDAFQLYYQLEILGFRYMKIGCERIIRATPEEMSKEGQI